MKSLVLVSLSLLTFSVHAADLAEVCRQRAVNYASEQFQRRYQPPKIWVDQAVEGPGNAYPTYRFQFRLSGEYSGTWAHQVWSITTTALRGSCGVTNSAISSETLDN